MYNYLYYTLYPTISLNINNIELIYNVNTPLFEIIENLKDIHCLKNITGLYYNDNVLDNNKTLYDYSIHDNTKLDLVYNV